MRKFVQASIVVVLVSALSYIGLHYFVKQKITHFLEKDLPKEWQLHYRDFSFSLLDRTFEIQEIELTSKSLDSIQYHTKINAEAIHLSGIQIMALLGDSISMNQLNILSPKIEYHPYRKGDKTKNEEGKKQHALLKIEQLALENGHLKYYKSTVDSLGITLSNINLNVSNFHSTEHIESRLQNLKDIKVSADSLHVPLSPFDVLKTGRIAVENGDINLSAVSIKTIVSPTEFMKLISKERDYFHLEIPKVTIKNPVSKNKDTLLNFRIPQIIIDSAKFFVYRDKLLPDDFSTKTLFNEKFRKLPFQLEVDSLHIKEAHIKYTEKHEYYNEGGSLNFANLNAVAYRLGNHFSRDSITTIQGTTRFMDNAQLDFKWDYSVHDLVDPFQFSAKVEYLKAADLDVLTRNNMDLLLKGVVDECDFQISGNKYESSYNFNIHYNDLEVILLNKRKGKKRWLPSKLLNLVIHKSSERNGKKTQNHSGTVQRDPTKSNFNYIWLNVKDGLKGTLLI